VTENFSFIDAEYAGMPGEDAGYAPTIMHNADVRLAGSLEIRLLPA
jgi:hypothetical protein